MKRRDRLFTASYLAPSLILFVLIFAYPLLKTVYMSFFSVSAMSTPMSQWKFVGLANYSGVFQNTLFYSSLKNILRIWLVGGVLTLAIALFYAVILASGVKGKKFWRSAIYLPNTVNTVALATMWIQYIFQNKFGLLKTLFTALGWDALAKINWTSSSYLFWGMLISYVFGSVGYFMLIFLAGIERIPSDIYESARIDGANAWVQFWRLTFPLIRDVFRTALTLWTVGAVNFFAWAKMFSSRMSPLTVTPVYYLYDKVFGSSGAITAVDAGGGAAVGVTIAIIVLLVHLLIKRLLKEEVYEY